MATFTDTTGAAWSLRITAGDLEALASAGLDLDDKLTPQAVQAVAALGPRKLGQVLWVLVEEQAEDAPLTPREVARLVKGGKPERAAGVEPEQFARRMDGDVLEGAVSALADAVIDFFHPKQTGSKLKSALSQVLTLTDQRQAERVAGIDWEALVSASLASAGNSPASSD